eukprot:936063-Rhodomonas_salina.1
MHALCLYPPSVRSLSLSVARSLTRFRSLPSPPSLPPLPPLPPTSSPSPSCPLAQVWDADRWECLFTLRSHQVVFDTEEEGVHVIQP